MFDNLPEYTTAQFDWLKNSMSFAAFASDIQFANMGAFYLDNRRCMGVKLRSERTGDAIAFAFREVKKDSEGDIQSWQFISTDAKRPFKMVIFND